MVSSACSRRVDTHSRDCETFRIPSLVSKRTIRIQDEGGWSGIGGTDVCGAATV